MSYDASYRFLRDDQRRLLSEPDRRREREVFIDCLAVLHDFAAGTGAFTQVQAEAVFSRTWHWNSAALTGLRQNLEINWKTAGDLRARGEERNFQEYVDGLLRQYQILRSAEAAASATSLQSSS